MLNVLLQLLLIVHMHTLIEMSHAYEWEDQSNPGPSMVATKYFNA